MGIGKAFSAVVIMAVAVMMVFSLLPVYAHNPLPPTGDGEDDGKVHGTCQGPWNGPFSIAHILDTFGIDVSKNDRNENDHVCFKGNPNGLIFRDDNPLPK